MAISFPHYQLMRQLRASGHLDAARGGRMLEIGQPEMYRDVTPETILHELIDEMPREDRDGWKQRVAEVAAERPAFGPARLFYRFLLGEPFAEVVSIDRTGSPSALKLDLNGDINLHSQFELIVNHGTAEHVFNIGNVFRVMHDHCRPGGLMIHESPFFGWVNHGFYCLQPTLFVDVAIANHYELPLFAIGQIDMAWARVFDCLEAVELYLQKGTIPPDCFLFVAFRKTTDAPFVVPIQGKYQKVVA